MGSTIMITDRQIQAAIKTATKETILNDGAGGRGTGSLRLIIRPGSARWVGFWQQDGRRGKKALGRYPDVSLRQAREKFAVKVRDVLAEGKNPRVAVVMTDKPTLENLFAGYIDGMRAKGRRSADDVEQKLKNVAKQIGADRLASEIQPDDISAFLGRVYRRGARVSADRYRAYLSAAFNWGIGASNDYTVSSRGSFGLKHNPVSAVPRDNGASKPRNRALAASEIRLVWNGIDGDGFLLETRYAIRMLICCGQRVMETLRAEGRDFDLDSMTWTMPPEKTKGGITHAIPLPPTAVPIVAELIGIHGQGPLFPERYKKVGNMEHQALNRALRRWLDKQDGFELFQTRDLRRTWKSRAHDAGVDRFTRDLIQQHAQGQDTGSRHYDRSDYMPQMKKAMQKWDAWLQSVIC